ncbi:MAG: hypothetical protein GY866_43525, partial [Proteobacteria bacterium]|nr:hypothetical protein [Pseudomonadota bacterium]
KQATDLFDEVCSKKYSSLVENHDFADARLFVVEHLRSSELEKRIETIDDRCIERVKGDLEKGQETITAIRSFVAKHIQGRECEKTASDLIGEKCLEAVLDLLNSNDFTSARAFVSEHMDGLERENEAVGLIDLNCFEKVKTLLEYGQEEFDQARRTIETIMDPQLKGKAVDHFDSGCFEKLKYLLDGGDYAGARPITKFLYDQEIKKQATSLFEKACAKKVKGFLINDNIEGAYFFASEYIENTELKACSLNLIDAWKNYG